MDWIIVFVILCLSCWCAWRAVAEAKKGEALENRLSDELRFLDEALHAQTTPQPGPKPMPEWLMPLSKTGEKLAGSTKSKAETEKLLAQAGFSRPGTLGLFLVMKCSIGVCAALAALFAAGFELIFGTFAFMLGAYVVGGIAPEWVLKAMAAKRHTAIERSMPDALDLMVICAEAGLPFSRIVKVVARELKLSAPALARELEITSAELEIFTNRSAALRNLAERTRVQSVESMVSTLIQAEQFGTPLAQALHNIAAESRSTLILTLEERAGKLPARLSIPLMTLILPPVVALVAAPALMRVIRSLMN